MNEQEPTPEQFLSELNYLIAEGFAEVLPNGNVRITKEALEMGEIEL